MYDENNQLRSVLKTGHLEVSDYRKAALTGAAAIKSGYKVVFIARTDYEASELMSWTGFFLQGSPVPFKTLFLPGPSIGPYEQVLPDQGFVNNRNAALYGLMDEYPIVIGMGVTTALRMVPGSEVLMDHIITVRRGMEIQRNELINSLAAAGYVRVGVVQGPGEYAVRGGVLDCFSPDRANPVRMDFFGDEVETLRYFDISTQRSLMDVSEAVMVPAGTFIEDPEITFGAIKRLQERRPKQLGRLEEFKALEAALERGTDFPGISGFEAMILGDLVPVSTYFDDRTLVMVVRGSQELSMAGDSVISKVEEDFQEVLNIGVRPDSSDTLFCEWHEFVENIPLIAEVEVKEPLIKSLEEHQSMADLASLRDENLGLSQRFDKVHNIIQTLTGQGGRVLLVAVDAREAARVRELLGHEVEVSMARPVMMSEVFLNNRTQVSIAMGSVDGLMWLDSFSMVIISTSLLFGKTLQGYKKKRLSSTPKRINYPFQTDDLVVHRKYGIGVFEGLAQLEAGGEQGEFLRIRYRDDAILYVPVYDTDLVTRYRAPRDLDLVKLDKLGGDSWSSRKRAARDSALQLASRLGELYALRSTMRGHSFQVAGDEFARFEEAFPYEETPDQARAMDEVLADLASGRPMDRLVVGDVGYGKTEVAMRAAYAVALAGKQVAVLVPTTLLAAQHRRVFTRRFQGTGVVVESISRMDGPKRHAQLLEGLRSGYVDIIIGTHRILSPDVVFKDLGLLVIDEEHRFGVRHKERIREIARSIDTLTLTATPIPRTLHMAFSGLRELSIMATPPKERIAIRSFVAKTSQRLVRRAIEREIERKGQVYYVHNRIHDQENVEKYVRKLVPNARVVSVHGRMKRDEIERVMSKFLAGEIDVLVTTTIIESGLDIPNANTMIIDRADTFGLAQLYQLRGRVGRSNREAFCYFLIPARGKINRKAQQRLSAIQRLSGVSGGFNLASADLEIRGAGNIFGPEQSGQAGQVGYDLYIDMVQEALKKLKREIEELTPCELELDMPMLIPKEQVPDSEVRLAVYRSIFAATSLLEVEELRASFIDRFGFPNIGTNQLFQTARLRILGTKLQLERIIKKVRNVKIIARPEILAIIGEQAISTGMQAGMENTVPPILSITFPSKAILQSLDGILSVALDMTQS